MLTLTIYVRICDGYKHVEASGYDPHVYRMKARKSVYITVPLIGQIPNPFAERPRVFGNSPPET
jgi:hypothetical protein